MLNEQFCAKSDIVSDSVEVYIEMCRKNGRLPEYKNMWDAGMDVYAAEEVVIKPGETKIVPTGLKMAIPPGYEIQVRPRSGISLGTMLRISNSPGTIDTGYRDELGIIVSNTSELSSYSEGVCLGVGGKGNAQGAYRVEVGDRIAQIVLALVPRMRFSVVENVKEIGEDRGGGFGSTGV